MVRHWSRVVALDHISYLPFMHSQGVCSYVSVFAHFSLLNSENESTESFLYSENNNICLLSSGCENGRVLQCIELS